VQNRPTNDHDYDSPSLKDAYVKNMRKNMPCRIYAAYAAYMPHICAAYFAKLRIILPKKVPCI